MKQNTNATAENEFTKLSGKELRENFRVCDHDGCPNSYTPWLHKDGRRLCLTHGKK